MPLNDWQPLPIVTTGDMWTAAQHNTYIRQNQQVLRDALALGHGQGSNVDMVDGRHGYQMEGWNGYVDLDATIPAGWVTIAEGNTRRVGWFEIVSTNHEYLRLFAGWMYGAQYHPLGAVLREWARVRYWREDESNPSYWTIRGIRIIRPDSNPVYGMAKIQVLWGGEGYVRIYQYTPNTAGWTRYGNQKAWDFVTPVQEEPAGYSAVKTLYPGNGSWRLARAFPGTGASAGWQSWSEMRTLFPPDNPSGWNPAVLMDGDTGTGLGAHEEAYFRATGQIPVKSVSVTVRYDHVTGGDTGYVYVKARAGTFGAWTTLGTLSFPSNALTTRTLTLSTPQMLRDFWLDMSSFAANAYLREFQIELAANGIWRGIPAGCRLRLYDAADTLLEEVRNETYTYDAPVMTIADMAQVAKVSITRPDGTTAWLVFPTWAVDGGALVNGDVLTLYTEY